MSQPPNDDLTLAADVRFDEPLKRVSFQPGMLLGLEATRAEQDYHRRHLVRHAYWLHGAGTVAGLAVRLDGDDPGVDTASVTVRLFVGPGLAVDGLGREVMLHEPYCLDLSAWLRFQHEDPDRWAALLRDGLEEATDLLWLRVTIRYQDCASGLQPVLATEVNAGTDPVQPSRIADSCRLEILAQRPLPAAGLRPWASHAALPSDPARLLTPAEAAFLDDPANAAVREELALAGRLLHALPQDNQALATGAGTAEETAELARLLLARVTVRLTPEHRPLPNPRRIQVNNLVRPFLLTPRLAAWLGRQG
ncbi:MAG: hypothetical protein AB1634_03280 [Thermodesulfobacteriota bacterium]